MFKIRDLICGKHDSYFFLLLNTFINKIIPVLEYCIKGPQYVYNNLMTIKRDKKRGVLLIDWHGTLSINNYWSSLYNYEFSSDVAIGEQINTILFRKDRKLVSDWMLGKKSSEEINLFLSQKLKLDYDWLWETFVHDCKYNMDIDATIKSELSILKKQYVIVLVTGNMDCFNRFTIPFKGLGKYFDAIYNSYETHLLKTDNNGLLFKKIINDLNLTSFRNTILIDDDKTTCSIFRQLGGKAINVDGPNSTKIALKRLVNISKIDEVHLNPK